MGLDCLIAAARSFAAPGIQIDRARHRAVAVGNALTFRYLILMYPTDLICSVEESEAAAPYGVGEGEFCGTAGDWLVRSHCKFLYLLPGP